MKKVLSNSPKYLWATLSLLFSIFATSSGAAVLYWDNNGLSTPTSGTWDLTTPQWATDLSPTASPVVWDPTTAAVFAVTNTGIGYLSNLTINVNSAIGIAGIYNNGLNGSSPVTNLIFTGTGSLDLAPGVNAISAGNGNIGAGSGNNNIFRVPITGVGSIDFQANVGSEYLSVPNTYSGGTTISTGNGINFSTNGVFGSGPITVNPSQSFIVFATPSVLPATAGGAPFATNNPISIPNDVVASTAVVGKIILVGGTSAPVTFSGNWDMGSQNQTLDFRTSTTTISGVMSGSGSLTKIGTSGILVLSGANTYSGKTLINVGTISVKSINSVVGGSASSGLGTPTTEADGTINLGATTTAGTLIYTGTGETTDRILNLAGTTGGGIVQNDGTGPLVFSRDLTATGAGAKTLTLQGTNTGDNRINGIIVNSSSPTAVTKAQSGTWTLAGANTFTGNISMNSGRLNIANPSALGGGTNVVGGTASFDNLTGSDLTVTNALTLSGGSVTYAGTANNMTYTGPVTISGANRTITVASNTLTLGGAITAGTFTFTKAGAGTLILTVPSAYTNTTVLTGGTLALGDDGATGTGAINLNSATATIRSSSAATRTLTNAITLSTDTTFGSSTTGDLIFTGPVNSGAVAKTLTINNATTTFNGVIAGTTATILTKAGNGTLVFNGANTYTKPTTINAGTLVLGSTGSIDSSASINIAGGATFDVSAISAYALSINSSLSANGTNSPAILKGGTTVNLGTRPISVAFAPTSFVGDTGHPSLRISQGTLSLSGNAFTVNNVSGTPLGAGTYQIIQQVTGSITSSGTHTVSVTGSGLVAGGVANIVVSGGDVNLVVTIQNAPGSFTGVSVLGDGNVQLSFAGTPGADYVVEATTNLNSPIVWIPLSTNTADVGGTFNFIDTDATNHTERYYRTGTQ